MELVEEGKLLLIMCIVCVNFFVEYKFYYEGKLVSLLSIGVFMFVSVKNED